MRIESVWEQALVELKKEVTDVSYDLWITKLAPIDFKDGILYLSITSESAKQRILKLHNDQIKNVLKLISCEIEDFTILDPIETEKYKLEDKIIENSDSTKSAFVSNFNAKYTFENFVVGNSNKYVYAAAMGIAKNPSSTINPLFIYGGVGLGKTHLLHAIGNYLKVNRPELKVLYVTCEKFSIDYIESLKKPDSISKFREKYRSVDVLIIDDIQFLAKKAGTQESMFHTFNDLYQNNKQIILASDRPPKEIAELEERLSSRFSMGLIQDIQTPDIETRIAILQKKADQEKYSVEDDVINFIAENCDTNIREMEGMLSKVCFYASLLGKEKTTMDEVKEALKDHVSTNKQSLTADRIIDCVCKYYNISKDDLIGKKKNKEIVEPRQIAMYIIYEMLDLPLTSIGEIFNGRDHTTVIYAREKVNSLIKENNRIKVTVNDIKSMASKN